MNRKWLSMAAIAWLAAGCATYPERYGDYEYADGEEYYVVDEVVYGGQASYYGGSGFGHDPYWRYSGYNYYSYWPSYYVWSPYYDPFYVGSFGYGPSVYYGPYRPYGGVSLYGYYGSYADPWYFGRRQYGQYGQYGRGGYHDGHRSDYGGRHYRDDPRGQRNRGRGNDRGNATGITARNEVRRLTTTPQPISRTLPKPSQKPRNGNHDRRLPKVTDRTSRASADAARSQPRSVVSTNFSTDSVSSGTTSRRAATRSAPGRPPERSRSAPPSASATAIPTRSAPPRRTSSASWRERVISGPAGSRSLPVIHGGSAQSGPAPMSRSAPSPGAQPVGRPSRSATPARSLPNPVQHLSPAVSRAPSRGVAPGSAPPRATAPRSAPPRRASVPPRATAKSHRRGGGGRER